MADLILGTISEDRKQLLLESLAKGKGESLTKMLDKTGFTAEEFFDCCVDPAFVDEAIRRPIYIHVIGRFSDLVKSTMDTAIDGSDEKAKMTATNQIVNLLSKVSDIMKDKGSIKKQEIHFHGQSSERLVSTAKEIMGRMQGILTTIDQRKSMGATAQMKSVAPPKISGAAIDAARETGNFSDVKMPAVIDATPIQKQEETQAVDGSSKKIVQALREKILEESGGKPKLPKT